MKKERLYYEVVQRNRKLFNGETKPFYFTQLHNRGKVGKKNFANLCKRFYGVKPEECYDLLNSASSVLLTLMLEGYAVDVPYLGTFKLVSNGTCSEDRKKAGAKAVRTIKVQFSPNPEFKAYFRRDNVLMIEWPKSKQKGRESK